MFLHAITMRGIECLVLIWFLKVLVIELNVPNFCFTQLCTIQFQLIVLITLHLSVDLEVQGKVDKS